RVVSSLLQRAFASLGTLTSMLFAFCSRPLSGLGFALFRSMPTTLLRLRLVSSLAVRSSFFDSFTVSLGGLLAGLLRLGFFGGPCRAQAYHALRPSCRAAQLGFFGGLAVLFGLLAVLRLTRFLRRARRHSSSSGAGRMLAEPPLLIGSQRLRRLYVLGG